MKILHCCLSNFYIENYNYQENLLPRQNKKDGHDVLILASTEIFKDNRTLGYVKPQTYINGDGIKVIRVSYRKIICNAISRKFRAYKGVYRLIAEFKPDVILFHGMSGWELLNVAKYAKKENVKLYVDNHASLENSGRNWVSLNILHRIFYKSILKKALPVVEKVFNIALEEYDFAKDIYGVPEDKLEYYPLGGFLPDDDIYESERKKYRKELGVSDGTIVFLHSGKFDKAKKTCELVRAFSKVKDERFRLVIAGEFFEDIAEMAKDLISQDQRVQYLGWKSGEQLLGLLKATDMYVQPGTRSATLQNAMCSKCAVMVYPYNTYRHLVQENGIYVESEEDICNAFKELSSNVEMVDLLRKGAFKRAQEILDYRVLAARIYEGIED